MNPKSNKVKRKIFWESICVFFIAIAPFVYKLYDYLPEDPEATISFLGFVIDNHGFADVSTFMWFLMSKIVPLYLLIFWFLTSKNWWYHIILLPIAMYSFQIFEVLFTYDKEIDTENLLWLLPVCMVVVPIVYFIRIKLYDKYVHGIDLEAMEAELRLLKQKQSENTFDKGSEISTENSPKKVSREYRSLSEKIEYGLSTNNLESKFKQFQNSLKSLLHL